MFLLAEGFTKGVEGFEGAVFEAGGELEVGCCVGAPKNLLAGALGQGELLGVGLYS